jgi:hypothetical protein
MKKKSFLIMFLVSGLFYLSHDALAYWSPAKRLTWNAGNSEDPAIAIDTNNHIHVVWGDETPGNYEIYYKKSTDGGASWITKKLSYNLGDSKKPSIAIDSNNHIHVVWGDETPGNYEIYYKKSTNGGASWTTKRLTYNSGDSSSPVIAIDSNNHIHVVWGDYSPSNNEIYYKKSTNGGTSWTVKRITYNSGGSFFPAIAINTSNHIHVAWMDDTPGNWEIYYKRSTNSGASWITKKLTYNSARSVNPAIAINSNNHIYVLWADATPGTLQLYYKKSTNNGTSWTVRRLTYTYDNTSDNPAIAIDSNKHIHVVWEECYIPLVYNLYYMKSTDGGANWLIEPFFSKAGFSSRPAIATDSTDYIHAVWYYDEYSKPEIYYRKGK